MTIEIRTPVSLHEHFAEQFHERDGATGAITPDAAIETAAVGLREAKELAQQLAARYVAIMSDDTKTIRARHAATRQMALKLSQKAAAALDNARERVQSELSRIRQDTAGAHRSSTATETEFRTRLATMPVQKRNELIAKVIDGGDDKTPSAISSARPCPLDQTDDQIERHRESWRRKQAERERRIRRALEALEIGDVGLIRWTDDLLAQLDPNIQDDARRAADETRRRRRRPGKMLKLKVGLNAAMRRLRSVARYPASSLRRLARIVH